MKRSKILAVITLAASMFSGAAATSADQKPTTAHVHAGDRPVAPASNDALLDMLNRRIPELRFNANAFVDVVDFLRDLTGANFVVDWNALERAGIAKDAPVTARLKDVKLSTGMELLFRSIGTAETSVVYKVQDNVILITTQDNPAPQNSASQARLQDSASRMQVVKNLRDACVDPDAMMVISIGALRSEAGLSREELIKLLTDELARTADSAAELSARNAMRLTLKDLYLEKNDPVNERRVLLDMLRDNGKAKRSALAFPATQP